MRLEMFSLVSLSLPPDKIREKTHVPKQACPNNLHLVDISGEG